MEAESLLDAALTKYGGKGWCLRSLDAPKCMVLEEAAIEEPIFMETFVAASCRDLRGIRYVNVLVDLSPSVPAFPLDQLDEQVSNNEVDMLPSGLKPKDRLPAGCRFCFVARQKEEGFMETLKIFLFQDKMEAKDAVSLCTGTPYAMVFRPGPWALKKAFFSLVERLPGYHVTWVSLSIVDKPSRRSQSSQWAPADEEILAGIQFINEQAPECDSQNQQTYWILCSIKEDANTPISGWPEPTVRMMAQNKSKGLAGAPLETEFPLNTYSLKPFVAEKLLPKLYPLLLNYAVMFLGWPGVGKTPAVIVMLLAMGRYHQSRLGLTTPPGWRRAKSLDNFRHRVGQIHEGVFLDDPNRDKIELADLKSFVTSEETQTCHGRYNDIKLVKNCPRAYASNDVQGEDEPEDDDMNLSISMLEFLTLLRRTFPGEKPADIRAVLKRTVIFVFGMHALYLRLPSQREDAPIHRIKIEDVHKDLLADHDKVSYGKYKNGFMEKPECFEEAVKKEQKMIVESMSHYHSFEKTEDYIAEINNNIYDLLLQVRRVPARAWLPASPESSGAETPAPVINQDPLPGTVQFQRIRRFFVGKFAAPTKRARTKTRMSEAAEERAPTATASEVVEPEAHEEEAGGQASLEGADLEADEEAARAMDHDDS